MDCSPPGSSVHGVLQARILEWVAVSFSRGSSQPRNRSQISCIAGRRFNLCATREALLQNVEIVLRTSRWDEGLDDGKPSHTRGLSGRTFHMEKKQEADPEGRKFTVCKYHKRESVVEQRDKRIAGDKFRQTVGGQMGVLWFYGETLTFLLRLLMGNC